MKKTVKKGAVIEEKITEIFIKGKNTVAMSNIDPVSYTHLDVYKRQDCRP